MSQANRPTQVEEAVGLAAWSGRSVGMPTAHRHGDLELNYVLEGDMTYLIGGGLVTLPRRRLCALWGGAPHQTVHSPAPVRLRWVTVPLASVLAWELPAALVRPLLAERVVVDAVEQPHDEALLARWEADLAKGEALRRHIVLLEIEARLRRLGLDLAEASERAEMSVISSTRRVSPALRAVERMAHFIAEYHTETLAAADIADAAHLHPNYAMTLFKQQTGMTLNQYLTQQRIAHAQRLLATTRQPVLDVALDSGFGSVSRFFEAFKNATGATPRQFRRRLSGA